MGFWDNLFDLCGMTTVLESLKEKPEAKEEASNPEEIKPIKFLWRPQTLDELIGQERDKALVRLNLLKIMNIKPVHFIISGVRGYGKSTLAYIIANHLGFDISTYIGGAFSIDNLKDFLVKNSDSERPNILFIDEIHGLPKEIAEFLYPLLENFILPLGNLKVRPFIFIGATTQKNILIRKFAPLVDRCIDVSLKAYTTEDIQRILKQYNDNVYQKNVTEEMYYILANSVRRTPRLAITFFDDLVVCGNIKMVLNCHGIVKDSLTIDDIRILDCLAKAGRTVGEQALAMIISSTVEDYRLIEPFLLTEGYLSRTAHGRILTDKGKKLLEELKVI